MPSLTPHKKVVQDDSDPIFDLVRKRLDKLSKRLKSKGTLREAVVKGHDDLRYEFTGVNGSRFAIYLYPGGEVFSRRFNGAYETFETAYTKEDKLETVNMMLSEAEFFIQNTDYFEELYLKKGRIIFRRLVYPDGTSESSSTVFAGKIRHYFGCMKQIKRPHNNSKV